MGEVIEKKKGGGGGDRNKHLTDEQEVVASTFLSVSVSPSQSIFIRASDCKHKRLENDKRVAYKYRWRG